MNDLYLIGNGFDLAHGLKTSYNDFLLWYLKESLQTLWNFDHFEDDLIKLDRVGSSRQIPSNFITISDLLAWLESHKYKRKAHHDFFERIIANCVDYKWVDVEYEYYLALIELYTDFKRSLYPDRNGLKNQLVVLNTCFASIKKKLVEYLKTIKINSKHENRKIESILLEGTGAESKEQGEKLFVNFNYTKTLDLYTQRNFPQSNNLINIHGQLDNPSNPIIFGYGDEMDPHYGEIENLNNNEFLKNIKSFGYFRTDHYQRVIRFIDSGEFTVKILGHSCGLSDRILLNTIFEHQNCQAIKIYYYQKSETENDYFEKTQEISRHFKASGKGDMRTKIVPFNQSVPLVSFVANN